MNRIMWAACLAFAVMAPLHAQPPQPPRPMPATKPVELVLEDQFERKASLAELRGNVVILVFGDRKGTDPCRALGEQLHVCWHPAARGLPAAKAQSSSAAPRRWQPTATMTVR